VRRVDLERPGQSRGPTEQLLIEVVADAADGLRDEEGGRGGVEEQAAADQSGGEAPN
jgi:hypothetical protein